MQESNCSDIGIKPFFELEDFMNFSRETRLEGQTLESLAKYWEEWLDVLQTKQLKSGQNSWLAVWLPENVELIVDQAWGESPAKGYMLNCLAQYLCMAAIQELLPQVASGGCAPSPRVTPELCDLLEDAGLLCKTDPCVPERRYSVITHYPFKGGCEICTLRAECPKANGLGDLTSFLLPGHERGKDAAQDGE